VLRVLNDDTVSGGMGFGTHPHDNMEIVSIPLEGDLEHKDSMGNVQVIRKGDVQLLSAGTGIYHSEYNRNKDKEVNFLQIWVFPNKRNVTPRYDQKTFDESKRENSIQTIVSPDGVDGSVTIQQDAWFSLSKIDEGKSITYHLHNEHNGLYVFVLSGNIRVLDEQLNQRDGAGITGHQTLTFESAKTSEILLMEIPMTL
jgi:redox-sensitive bicupin YhaK (pirin superfamily)